jgi:transcriptional regulator GlxA family with amidase domain
MVFPSFQALDVFGPLDFLNMVSLNRKLKLTVIGPTLDPVSTKPTAMNAAGSDFGQSILPTHTFANPPKDLEVLLVPGGLGTRSPAPWVQEAVQFINQTYPNLKYIVSVCTGASFLARAGVLEGKHATTNKRSWAFVTGFGGPNVHWVPVARWVADGKVWSTSGVAAGMDGMLGFIEYLYGTDVAWEFANGSEYEWHSDPSWDPFAKFWNVPGSNATQLGVSFCLMN